MQGTEVKPIEHRGFQLFETCGRSKAPKFPMDDKIICPFVQDDGFIHLFWDLLFFLQTLVLSLVVPYFGFIILLPRSFEEGNVEFVFRVSIANSEIMLIGDISCRSIFCCVVDYQQASVFSSIHVLCFKDVVATSKDIHGNTLLYMAANQALAAFLNRIYGSTLQIQRESQWFKEVEMIILSIRRVHRDLMNQVTVAFTVPGGNDNSFCSNVSSNPYLSLLIRKVPQILTLP
ncbi:hypothetical protein K1719_045703 [Acacia pycnantha]|nr:hypothetical protein K1719_045703 [Acacia pycnantha]